MSAHLDGQRAVRVRAFDRERRALESGFFGVRRVVDLDAVVVLLRPADVHTHEHLGPVCSVDTARTGADVDERVALVVLAREHGLDFHRRDVVSQARALGVGVGHRVGAFVFCQFVEDRHLVESLA